MLKEILEYGLMGGDQRNRRDSEENSNPLSKMMKGDEDSTHMECVPEEMVDETVKIGKKYGLRLYDQKDVIGGPGWKELYFFYSYESAKVGSFRKTMWHKKND